MPYYNHFNKGINISVSKFYELCEIKENYVILSDSEFKLLQNCNSVRIDTKLEIPDNKTYEKRSCGYIICYGYISAKKNISKQQLFKIAEDSMNNGFLVFGGKSDNHHCIECIKFFDRTEQNNKISIACLIECKIKDAVSELAFGIYDFLYDCNILKSLEPDFELHITKQIDYIAKYNALYLADENSTKQGTYPNLENLSEIWESLVSGDEAVEFV